MALRIVCPGCKTVLGLPDSLVGKKMRCAKCQQVFLAGAAAPRPQAATGEPRPAPPVLESAIRSRAGTPPTRPLPVRQTAAPHSRPKALAQKSSGKGWLLGALAAVLLLAGGGVAYWAFFTGQEPADTKPPEQGQAQAEPPRPLFEIKPPALEGDKVARKLPDTVGDVAVGGGGRFLVLHLPRQRKLAVFDVNEARVVKYLPVAEDNVKFAAGLDKLVVVLPDKGLLQRWDLASFEREVTAPLPFQGVVKTVSMGSAARGPLLVHWAQGTGALDATRFEFLDVQTLKTRTVRWTGFPNNHCYRDAVHVRASADGQVFGLWCTSHTPQGLETFVLTGNEVKAFYEHGSAGHLVPGPDGRVIYTGGGLFSNDVKALGDRRGGISLPAVQGDYYLTLSPPRDGFRPEGGTGKGVALHIAGDSRPLLNLADIEVAMPNEGWAAHDFTLDKRVHFIPDAKLLVTIPGTNDQLVLHRLDVEQALEKSGIDYLFVTSRPPLLAARGQTYAYRLAVKSKKGGVKCRLESGPEGMKLSPEGGLTWQIPADFGGDANVIIAVSDRTGQEVFHTFKVAVVGADQLPARGPVQVAQGPRREPEPVVKAPQKEPEPAVQELKKAPRPALEKPGRAPALVVKEPKKDPEPVVKELPKEPEPAAPPPIKAPALDGDRVQRLLPGTVGQVVVGGGGRYLILHLPKLRKLAVFDASEGKIVKYLPVAEDSVRFAAGLEHLIIFLPRANVLQRWSLARLEREAAVANPVQGTIRVMGMGSASRGPLVFGAAGQTGGLVFLDPRTFKEIKYTRGEGRGGGFMSFDHYPPTLRVGPDGQVIGVWTPGLSPSGLRTLVLQGRIIKEYYEHTSVGQILPGPDGKTLFTGAGLYTPELKPLGKRQGGFGSLLIPAVHGRYYLSFLKKGFERNAALSVALHMLGDERPLLTLTDLEGLKDYFDPFKRTGYSLDQRIFLVPDAKLLVLIPPTADKLVLHRLDVDKALEKSDIDFLLVTSQPPATAAKGRTYTYQLVVKSKKGGVKYRLETGPQGMVVSPQGKLNWKVPADFAEAEADVIVSVSDRTGQEAFHTFKITVTAKAADVPEVKRPAPEPEQKPAVEPENKPAPRPEKGPAPEPEKGAEPAVAALAIKPPALPRDQVERGLPGAIGDVVEGGGGRFLILHLPRQRKLAIFDVNEAQVVKFLPLAEDNVKFAAGLDKLLVVLPEKNILQRWSLRTFEREVSVTVPTQGKVTGAYMGSASPGPLLLCLAGDRYQDSGIFVDVATLKLKEFRWEGGGRMPGIAGRLVRVSADGKTFAARTSVGAEPHDVVAINLQEGSARARTVGLGGSIVVPGPDGRLLYTATGVFNDQLKLVAGKNDGYTVRPFLPAAHGGFFLQLEPGGDPLAIPRARGTNAPKGRLAIFLPGDQRPFTRLEDVEGVCPEGIAYGRSSDLLNHDKRVHFIPDAKLIITIPASNDKLLLYRFDVEKALEKAEVDYLVVVSRPVELAPKGKTYSYQLVVKSKKGGVKYRLETGPQGMAVSAQGRLTWKVPADFADAEADVIVSVSDRAGQEVFHTFKVRVGNKTAGVPEAELPVPVPKIKLPPAPEKEPAPEPEKEPAARPENKPAPGPEAKQDGPKERSSSALGIKPPALGRDKVERVLPATIGDVAVGGGGRFLILHLPRLRKLAVFDVNEGKVVRYIGVGADNIKFTAGLDSLFVVLCDKGILQRWSLKTFTREVSVSLPSENPVWLVLMGSASRGPLLVGGVGFLDPRPLKPLAYRRDAQGNTGLETGSFVRASADGQTFGIWRFNLSPQGLQTMVLAGRQIKGSYQHESVGHVIPGPNGKVIYTARGRYTREGRPLGKSGPRVEDYLLPAVHGNFYLKVLPGPRSLRGYKVRGVAVYMEGDDRPLVNVDDVELDEMNTWDRDFFGNDKRIHLIPDAELLVTIPASRDRLVLRRFKLEEALEKSGIDYLLVTSRPPASARKGTTLTYQLAVKSKKGGVKYRLESGPQGMAVSPAGKLTWKVPADYDSGEVRVILAVSDRTGQEAFHNFSLALQDK